MANAGYAGHPHETLDYPMDEFNKIFDINIKGTLRTFRVAVPFLVGRPDPLIVAISSASSVMPFGSYAPYAMSKAAVDSLVRTTALELMGKVRVYSIKYVSKQHKAFPKLLHVSWLTKRTFALGSLLFGFSHHSPGFCESVRLWCS